nr:MAG TPA: hypothetical protein [Caudoviricetes sp.]DAO71804.1 MAG TPA: hypothetical protein [Caudoviricetes sp.]
MVIFNSITLFLNMRVSASKPIGVSLSHNT